MQQDLGFRTSMHSRRDPSNTRASISTINFLINVEEARSSTTNVSRVAYMGVCFLILYTAFTSTQNLMSEIYDQIGYKSLGQTTLLVLYAAFGISIMIVPAIIKRWSYKKGVYIGALGHLPMLLAGVMTVSCTDAIHPWCGDRIVIYSVNLGGALVSGVSSAVIYLAANRYVTGCANSFNKGQLMGVFFGFYSCSNVFGNIMAAFVIDTLGQYNFYLLATIIAGVSIIMISFAEEVPNYDDHKETIESVTENAKVIIRLALSDRMKSLWLYMFFTGLIIAVYNGFEYKVIVSTITYDTKIRQDFITAMVFTVQGIVAAVSNYAARRLADIYQRALVLNLFILFFFLAILFSFLSYFTGSLFLALMMGMFWGAGYSGASTMAEFIMAKDFDGSIESFAVLQLVRNIAAITGFAYSIFVTNIFFFLLPILGLLVATQISTRYFRPKELA